MAIRSLTIMCLTRRAKRAAGNLAWRLGARAATAMLGQVCTSEARNRKIIDPTRYRTRNALFIHLTYQGTRAPGAAGDLGPGPLLFSNIFENNTCGKNVH